LSLCWCLWWCTCCHLSALQHCRLKSGEQQWPPVWSRCMY
jgi:hypothetical protein